MKTNLLKRALGAVSCSALLAFGCGGEDDSFKAASIPVSELPAQYAGALCAALEQCAGSALVSISLQSADCSTLLRRRLEDELVDLPDLVRSGKVTYDGSQFLACVEKVESLGCEAFAQRDLDACTRALAGKAKADEECRIDIECAPGNFCRTDLNSPSGACPGTCVARGAMGAACTRDEECASGMKCNGLKCEKPGSAGDACGGVNDPECGDGLACVGGDRQANTAGQCRKVADVYAAGAGAECDLDPAKGKLCKDPLVCVIESAALTGVTAKCGDKSEAGAPCKLSFPDQCPADEYCKLAGNPLLGVVDGTCTKKPKDGEDCGTGLFGGPICAAYSACVEGKCESLERLGGACTSGAACYSENCVGGKCVSDTCQ